MQRLHPIGVRIGRTSIETAEFEFRSKDIGDTLQDLRHSDHSLEYFSFIDQIGQAASLRFLLEFGAGKLPFFTEELINPLPQRSEQFCSHEIFEDEISIAIEPSSIAIIHGRLISSSLRI